MVSELELAVAFKMPRINANVIKLEALLDGHRVFTEQSFFRSHEIKCGTIFVRCGFVVTLFPSFIHSHSI